MPRTPMDRDVNRIRDIILQVGLDLNGADRVLPGAEADLRCLRIKPLATEQSPGDH